MNPLRWGLLFAAVLVTLCALIVFASFWATSAARLYYETGFDDAVADALKEIPGSAKACIYDDSQHIFVTSIDQLDAGRMIEKALRDRVPGPRPAGLRRDPHFRVLADGKTYYWSFRDAALYPFPGTTWTLSGLSARMCSDYLQSPQIYEEAFSNLYGITVTARNFCCGLEEET